MNLQEVVNKASKNLHWQYDSGAGLQLYGDIPQDAKNHVEYVIKPKNCTLFTLKTPDSYSASGMAAWTAMLGYERWVQFAPPQWDEMQKANAVLMTHAAKHILQLAEALRQQIEITESLSDQQAMPDDHWIQPTERNKVILANAETVS